MLYALSRAEVVRIRRGFVSQYPGAEMLWAAYRTDRAVVAGILPRPLRPAPEPLVLVFVAHYPETNFGSAYSEAALFLLTSFRGRIGGYCLAMPVDDDSALICGREFFAFPKKLAHITLEHRGGTVVGRVARRGAEILRIEATLGAPADLTSLDPFGTADVDAGRPCRKMSAFNFKSSFTSDGRKFEYVPRLLDQVIVLRPRPGLLSTSAEVVVTSTPFDPLGELPVIGQPLTSVYGIWDNTLLPGRVVARAWNMLRFAPYSAFKFDVTPVVLGYVGGASGPHSVDQVAAGKDAGRYA